MSAPLRLPTAALALALVALLACSLWVPAAGAVTNGLSGASESTTASDSSTSATDDGNSTTFTTEESTTATTAADSSESSSSDDSAASSTTTDDSGGSSSDSTTAGSSESSSEDSSTTASDSSTSDSSEEGGSSSTTSEESGGSSSDSSTTDESGSSSSNSSSSEESGTNSSDSSSSEESSTSSSNSSTTEEPDSSSTKSNTNEESTSNSSDSSTTEESNTNSTNSNTTEESTTNSSNSSTTEEPDSTSSNSSTTEESGTTSSNSNTTEESGANSTSSDTTASSEGSSSNSTTDDGSSSSNDTTSSSSDPGSSSGGNGTNSGSSNSSSADGGSYHNVSNSGIFLQPGPGKDNYDITKKGEYFDCGGSGSDVNIRLVARYDKPATAAEMAAYLNSTSDEYKAEEAMIKQMPNPYQLGGETVYLADVFTVTLARKVEDAKVEFEISCKLKMQTQAEVVAANLTSTEPYSTWSNLRFSKACNMQPNRVVPVAMKFTDETFDIAMRDRSSEAFTSFVASIRLALLERLRSQVPAVQDVVVLSLSNGSVVAETAVMVDSSGNAEKTRAIHTAAEGTTKVNGKPTQSVQTTQSEDYVAVMDTVNAAASGNASESSVDTDLTDDKVPGITTESPNRVVSSDSNGYFLNVTVPSFLALILLIAIFLFCTVNSNSCLCQLCASNVKKEVKLV